MASRLGSALAAVLIAAILAPATVLADGDPASDVLLGASVFYPYSPPTATAVAKQLDAEAAAAQRAGFPIKVALIGNPVDLGVIPDLFGKPQQYAKFLDQEISFQKKEPLLVVMAAGYGTQALGLPATRAAASLPKPSGTTPTELATAALTAVQRLAAASGHPLKDVPGSAPSSSGSGFPTVLVVILAFAALGATAGVLALRRRQTAST